MVHGSRLTITVHGHPYGSRSVKVKVTHGPYLRHSTTWSSIWFKISQGQGHPRTIPTPFYYMVIHMVQGQSRSRSPTDHTYAILLLWKRFTCWTFCCSNGADTAAIDLSDMFRPHPEVSGISRRIVRVIVGMDLSG